MVEKTAVLWKRETKKRIGGSVLAQKKEEAIDLVAVFNQDLGVVKRVDMVKRPGKRVTRSKTLLQAETIRVEPKIKEEAESGSVLVKRRSSGKENRLSGDEDKKVDIKGESVGLETCFSELSGAVDESLAFVKHEELSFSSETFVAQDEPGSKRRRTHVAVEMDPAPGAPNIFSPVAPADVLASQPQRWNEIYNHIVAMRAKITTPVDTMGCERMPESISPGLKTFNPKLYRFQLLVSLMLSSQTKDEVNFQAMNTLNKAYREKGYENGLCLEAIRDSTELEIDGYICKVGFHRKKAVYIKKTAEMLFELHHGDLPKAIEEIVAFPGVGPKMGFLLLQNGWGINAGIGVDVHLHRLAQMWNWVQKSDKPEVTRAALEKWLPKKYWGDINPLLVGFGQVVCVPRAANCDVCTLAATLCKKYDRKLVNAEMTPKRLAKLKQQRGDLTKLLKEI